MITEATEPYAAYHLYLKRIAKLMISVLLPESAEPMRPFSNWEVLDQLKSLIALISSPQFSFPRVQRTSSNLRGRLKHEV